MSATIQNNSQKFLIFKALYWIKLSFFNKQESSKIIWRFFLQLDKRNCDYSISFVIEWMHRNYFNKRLLIKLWGRNAIKLGQSWYQKIMSQSSNLYAYLNGSLLRCKPPRASCRVTLFLYVLCRFIRLKAERICKR